MQLFGCVGQWYITVIMYTRLKPRLNLRINFHAKILILINFLGHGTALVVSREKTQLGRVESIGVGSSYTTSASQKVGEYWWKVL